MGRNAVLNLLVQCFFYHEPAFSNLFGHRNIIIWMGEMTDVDGVTFQVKVDFGFVRFSKNEYMQKFAFDQCFKDAGKRNFMDT